MKNVTILRFLTAVGSALSTVAALDLAGVADVFDPGTSKYLLAAGPAALALKELVVVLGDWFDDGKPNKSFKIGVLCFLAGFSLLPFFTSCSAPPVTGRFTSRDGFVRIHPDGRFQLVVEPRSSK
jgi:hypothetical protein